MRIKYLQLCLYMLLLHMTGHVFNYKTSKIEQHWHPDNWTHPVTPDIWKWVTSWLKICISHRGIITNPLRNRHSQRILQPICLKMQKARGISSKGNLFSFIFFLNQKSAFWFLTIFNWVYHMCCTSQDISCTSKRFLGKIMLHFNFSLIWQILVQWISHVKFMHLNF